MERICNLYIDSAHLSITLTECIRKEIENGSKVIIVAQEDIRKSIRNIKTQKDEKEKRVKYIQNLDESILNNLKDITIIIQGEDEFIKQTEIEIQKKYKNENINVISCYNIANKINVADILNNYTKLLNTTGIIDIKREVEQL